MTDKEPKNTPSNEPSAFSPESVGEDSSAQAHAYPSIFDKPDHSDEKQTKKRRLSRGGRNVLLTLLLCAALAGSVFGIYRFLPKQPGDDVSSSDAVKALFDYTKYIT